MTAPLSTAVASAGGLSGHEVLEYVLDRVLELEGRLSNIRNDLDARYDEIEERMEAFHAVVEGGVNLLLWIRRIVKSTTLGL